MNHKSNAAFVWPAILLMLIVCPALSMAGYTVLGMLTFLIGLCLIIYAMATGRLKLFG